MGKKKKNGKDKEEGESSCQPPPPPPPLLEPINGTIRVRARPDGFLVVCRCFSVITAAAALLCVAVNAIAAYAAFADASDIFDGIFRCFAVLIALFVAIAETEWGFVFKIWGILEYWTGRGMLQIFVAVMTRAYYSTTESKEAIMIVQYVASYMLLGCGIVYIVSALLCIGRLKRHHEKKELTKEQAAKHLEELERRRDDLRQQLLIDRV